MDDFEKWMKVVNEGFKEKKVQKKIVSESVCNCKQYDCTTCFPSTLKENKNNNLLKENEIFDLVIDLSESEKYEKAYDKLDEGVLGFAPIRDMTSNALVNEVGPVVSALSSGAAGTLGKAVADAALSKIGDKQQEIDELKGDNVEGDMSPMSDASVSLPTDPNYVDEDDPDGYLPAMNTAPPDSDIRPSDPTSPKGPGPEGYGIDIPDDNFDMQQGDDLYPKGGDGGSVEGLPSAQMQDPEADFEDTSELVGKIAYMQDMGMSSSNRHYDVDRLNDLNSATLNKIFSQVMGEDDTVSLEAVDSTESEMQTQAAADTGSNYAEFSASQASQGDGNNQSDDEFFENLIKQISLLDEEADADEKKADKDYDKDGKIESERDEHYGSVGNAIEDEDKVDESTKKDKADRDVADDESREIADKKLGKFDPAKDFPKESVKESCDSDIRSVLNKLFG